MTTDRAIVLLSFIWLGLACDGADIPVEATRTDEITAEEPERPPLDEPAPPPFEQELEQPPPPPPELGSSRALVGEPTPAEDGSAELFDEALLPRFDIVLPRSSIDRLRSDPETYASGDLKHAGQTLCNVGIRLLVDGGFRTLDEKAAFEVKVDAFVATQSLRGLSRVRLHNMIDDPSFMAERLAYAVFREAGLPAPRANSALVYVNGELYGVYTNVEATDAAFLRRWFDDASGALHEEGEPVLLEALGGTAPETFMGHMGEVLDVRQFVRFSAIETLVDQPETGAYAAYRDPGARRFVLMPSGMDLALKAHGGRAHVPVFERAGRLFSACLASEECRSQYAAAVREQLALYESLDLQARAEKIYEQIAPHVALDPRSEVTPEQFDAAYAALLESLATRGVAVRNDLGM